MLKYFERWVPALTIRRAARFSEQLEDQTGYQIHVVDSDGTLCFFLIDPYGDPQEPDPYGVEHDFWDNLDDCISDLSYFNGYEVNYV